MGNKFVEHEFHLIPSTIDINADGILGKDFLTKFMCNINYEHWLLQFHHQGEVISHPIEEEASNRVVLPFRSEVIRKVKLANVQEDSIVKAEETKPGIFCGNTIITQNEQYVKFIKTTDENVILCWNSFKPQTEPLKNYSILKYMNNDSKN